MKHLPATVLVLELGVAALGLGVKLVIEPFDGFLLNFMTFLGIVACVGCAVHLAENQ